ATLAAAATLAATLLGARFAAFATDFSHVLAIPTYGLAAFSANLCHVLAVLAHCLAAFSGGFLTAHGSFVVPVIGHVSTFLPAIVWRKPPLMRTSLAQAAALLARLALRVPMTLLTTS
ncbi:MAG: hypothetical protein LC772_13380, partial [Chloroflexi bacterium]|nr:hypothetical protein [Chloroflexota bacterium]